MIENLFLNMEKKNYKKNDKIRPNTANAKQCQNLVPQWLFSEKSRDLEVPSYFSMKKDTVAEMGSVRDEPFDVVARIECQNLQIEWHDWSLQKMIARRESKKCMENKW